MDTTSDPTSEAAEPAGEALLEALRRERKAVAEARREAASYRIRLRAAEARHGFRALAWRPAGDLHGELVGFADVELAGLTIYGLRLLRRAGGYVTSWPMRRPMGSDRLLPVVRPTPELDARVLATLLAMAYPERVAP